MNNNNCNYKRDVHMKLKKITKISKKLSKNLWLEP